jgi:hypothetical protein
MKNPSQHPQRGAALLMMMLALIAISSALSYQYLGDMGQKLKRQNYESITDTLVSAKVNLLSFTESIPELYGSTKSPGFFVCPDLSPLADAQSGFSSGSCGSSNNAIGRLPSIKKDSSGGSTNEFFYFAPAEKHSGASLWYAIDDLYRNMNSATTNPLDLMPSMTLDGNAVVAVIIAAHAPLSGQINNQSKQQVRNATEAASLQWDDHIEALTANNTFVSRKQRDGDLFNDQIIAITKSELDTLLKNKVCELAKKDDYCNAPPTWFATYGWSAHICPTSTQCN